MGVISRQSIQECNHGTTRSRMALVLMGKSRKSLETPDNGMARDTSLYLLLAFLLEPVV
jgi:hypothetical protein